MSFIAPFAGAARRARAAPPVRDGVCAPAARPAHSTWPSSSGPLALNTVAPGDELLSLIERIGAAAIASGDAADASARDDAVAEKLVDECFRYICAAHHVVYYQDTTARAFEAGHKFSFCLEQVRAAAVRICVRGGARAR